jgi:hypothetical protein
VIPAYKYKKFYGALIAACPPFNLFVLPFLPFFAMIRSQNRVRRINNMLVKVIFFPFALIYSTVFLSCNLLMLPLAYLKSTWTKLRLAIIFKDLDSEERRTFILNFLQFLVAGPILLLLSQFVDIYYFMLHLYAFDSNKLGSDFVASLPIEAFNTLEAVVQREIKQLKSVNPKDPLQVPTERLIKILRTELEIALCIQSLLFGKFLSLKE